MQHSMAFSSLRISFIFSMLLALGLMGGCDCGSKWVEVADSANNNEINEVIFEENTSAVAVNYNGETAIFDQNLGLINATFIDTQYSVIVMGLRSGAESEEAGTIVMSLQIEGTREDTLEDGTYDLKESIEGAMTAALMIERVGLGIPERLTSQSGTFTVNPSYVGDEYPKQLSIRFDGVFVDASDEDGGEYALTGRIEFE